MTGGTRSNRRGRETSERIWEAASRCFHEKGLDLTLDDVAAAAETTRMTVHRHTGGREPLIARVAMESASAILARVAEILEGAKDDWPRAVADAVVQTVREGRAQPAVVGLFTPHSTAVRWREIDPDERAVDLVREFFLPVMELGQQQNLLRRDTQETLGFLLEQIMLYLMAPETVVTMDDVARRVELFVIPAVLAR